MQSFVQIIKGQTLLVTIVEINPSNNIVRGNCVLVPVLNPNSDFNPTIFHFAFLLLLFGNEVLFYDSSMNSM